MSAEPDGADAAWQSNWTNPAQAVSESLPGDSDLPDERPDVPTPKERLAELAAEYPRRMNTPLSEQHGRKIRESCLDEPETIRQEIPTGEVETQTVSDIVSRKALPLYAAVADLLETYEGYRDKKLQMAKGYGDDAEQFLVDLGISFSPEYQSKTYAKISALERQFTGGEYPNGGTTNAEFAEPMTVLFGLTASSKSDAAESGFRPLVDHDRDIRDAWSGDSNSVKRSLRYVLQDVLDLDSTDYAWWWQAEPHPGDGEAAGYSHAHPVVILDADAADRSADQITPDTFRPVVAKHVERCDGAEWAAHQITDDEKSAVKVSEPDEIDELAQYVSKYLAIGPDEDLLERSPEYLMWAASQWATSTQKYSKSETATAAIDADRCQQQWLDPEAEQDRQHGERVVRASDAKQRRGINWVCSECGSHHGIDQSEQSLVRMRLDERETAATPTVAADGGLTVSAGCDDGHAEDGGESGAQSPLSERWPSAQSGGAGGEIGEWVKFTNTVVRWCSHGWDDNECPLCQPSRRDLSPTVPIPDDAANPQHLFACLDMVDPSEPDPKRRSASESFEREPQWRPDSIVQAWDDDDDGTPLGAPGGTCYGRVIVEGAGSALSKSMFDELPSARVIEGPEPWQNTSLFDEADVRSGRVPPPEIVDKEKEQRGTKTRTANGSARSVPVKCPHCSYEFSAHPAGQSLTCPESVDSDGDSHEFVLSANTRTEPVTEKEWSNDWYAERFETEADADDAPGELADDQAAAIRELVRTEGIGSPVAVCGRLSINPDLVDAVGDVIDAM